MRLLLRLLVKWPTLRMLRLAAVLGLMAMAVMSWAVIDPTPLPVVASMSFSPVFAGLAFLIFGLSIAADLAQAQARVHKVKLGGK
jgi:hypothetical protein